MEDRTFETLKKQYFYGRTNTHIDLVKKYVTKLVLSYPKFQCTFYSSLVHDYSKFELPELPLYIDITWNYKCRKEGKPEIEVDEDKVLFMTYHHIKNNTHHPEYHADTTINCLNLKDRDGIPTEPVNACKMPDSCIAEMVCDWLAISEELKNNIWNHVNDNVGTRWLFTPEQIELIENLINFLKE